MKRWIFLQIKNQKSKINNHQSSIKLLAHDAEAGADHRSLAERVRAAVRSACSRRGLSLRTKQCYGAWAARYALFAKDERAVMEVLDYSVLLTIDD